MYHVTQCVIIALHPFPGQLLSPSAYEAQVAWRLPFNGHSSDSDVTSYFVFVWCDINNNLQPNTQYNYCVVAENGHGNGSSSDYGEFTTLPLPPLSPPRNLQVTVISTAVNISWKVPQFNSSVDKIRYALIQF